MLLTIGQFLYLITVQSVLCSVEILNYISDDNIHLQQNPNNHRINMTVTPKGHYIDHADNRVSYFPPGENVWSITAVHQFLFGDTEIYSNNTRGFNSDLVDVPPISPDKPSDPVHVEFYSYTTDLMNFEIETQSLNLILWPCMTWHDPRLMWNASEFGGTNQIDVQPDRIWVPDLTLLNSADGNIGPDTRDQTAINIYSNGVVKWCPFLNMKIMCPMAMYYFPFDYQTCMVKLGSWRYTRERIAFHFITEDTYLTHYKDSNTWSLKETVQLTHLDPYPSGIWQDLKIFYIFKRNPNQYIINVVCTCMALTILSALSFFVPCSSGERLGLCLSVVIAISVYQLVAMDVIPRGTEVTPFLSLFLAILLFLVFISVAITMFQLHLYCEKQKNRPSDISFKLVLFVGRCLLMDRSDNFCPAWSFYRQVKEELKDKLNFLDVDKSKVNPEPQKDVKFSDINQLLTDEEHSKLSEIEWDLFGSIIDRVSFVIYILIILGTTAWLVAYQNHDDIQLEKAVEKIFGSNGMAFK